MDLKQHKFSRSKDIDIKIYIFRSGCGGLQTPTSLL